MKQKQILLLTTFTLLIQGCGSNPEDSKIVNEEPSIVLFYKDIKPEDRWKYTIETLKHTRAYLFSKFNIIYDYGIGTNYWQGVLSKPAKDLTKKKFGQD